MLNPAVVVVVDDDYEEEEDDECLPQPYWQYTEDVLCVPPRALLDYRLNNISFGGRDDM